MENKIKIKGSYDEKSPITGNFTVLVEPIINPKDGSQDLFKMCMETGFQTYSKTWKETEGEFLDSLEKQMPSYVAAAKVVADDGSVWYPTMNMSYTNVLHPHLNDDGTLGWAVSSITPIESEEDIKTHMIVNLPIQTSQGPQIALFKVSPDPLETWDTDEFELAFDFHNELNSVDSENEEE